MLFSRRFLKFITLFLALNLSSSVYSSDLRRFGIYTVRDGEKNIPTLKKKAGNIESLNLKKFVSVWNHVKDINWDKYIK